MLNGETRVDITRDQLQFMIDCDEGMTIMAVQRIETGFHILITRTSELEWEGPGRALPFWLDPTGRVIDE